MTFDAPGRSCPPDYRYPANTWSREPDFHATAVYVIGGLYGNSFALDTVEAMLTVEPGAVAVFNGDFHWFDTDPGVFADVQQRVLAHRAIRGNVETEIARDEDAGAGCGCGYPDSVSGDTVARSNEILKCLRASTALDRDGREALRTLPMTCIAGVGEARIGIVHGDAETLAGWHFAHDALQTDHTIRMLTRVHELSTIDVFASTHTCLPALRRIRVRSGSCVVANNGAAGMPNFRGTTFGLLTRIGVPPSPHASIYGLRCGGLHIDALPIVYNQARWVSVFQRMWPMGSLAHHSYHERILHGPAFTVEEARPWQRASEACVADAPLC